MTFIDLPRLKVLVTTFPHMHTITLVKLDFELLWSLSQFTIPWAWHNRTKGPHISYFCVYIYYLFSRCTGCSYTQFRCYSDRGRCVSASDIILWDSYCLSRIILDSDWSDWSEWSRDLDTGLWSGESDLLSTTSILQSGGEIQLRIHKLLRTYIHTCRYCLELYSLDTYMLMMNTWTHDVYSPFSSLKISGQCNMGEYSSECPGGV